MGTSVVLFKRRDALQKVTLARFAILGNGGSMKYLLLGLVVCAHAMAVEKPSEEFVNNPFVTRLVVASITATDGAFKNSGLACYTGCETVKNNFELLLARVEFHNQNCDDVLSEMTESKEHARKVDNLSSLKHLGKSNFISDNQAIDSLLSKMDKLATDDRHVVKEVDYKFAAEFKEDTCEKQFLPLLRSDILGFKKNSNDLSGVNAAILTPVCKKVEALKACLSRVYSLNREMLLLLRNKDMETAEDRYQSLRSVTGIGK